MDYPKECKLHERNFTLLQIGDKRLQYVQSIHVFLSHANSRIGFMQNETFFASCICLNLHSSAPAMENMQIICLIRR
jgi:hypothetical protein